MIPRLRPNGSIPLPAVGFFQRLVEAGFDGDIETGAASRTVFSTDNSIYQIEPTGILFPKGVEDLQITAAVLSEPAFRGITRRAARRRNRHERSIADLGIVVDCSRHMNSILEIDPIRRLRGSRPGVVKDQLNRALEALRPVFRAGTLDLQPRHHRRHGLHRCLRPGFMPLWQDQQPRAGIAHRACGWDRLVVAPAR